MDDQYILIDGSQGEGGGQILRTSLSLSMCLGVAIRVENVRAGRNKPGLLRQHLTCVRAAKKICGAEVTGDELGSQRIQFNPKQVQPGEYFFPIGSAGSTSLVFQTVLPALLGAESQSKIRFEGGTHNMQAPSYEFLTKSFLNALRRMNCQVETELLQYGFYPNGGGIWIAEVKPQKKIKRLDLLERGTLVAKSATTYTSKIPRHVSQRELNKVAQKLQWPIETLLEKEVEALGPGNLISLELAYDNTTEVFDEVAQRGLSAERVAGKAVSRLQRYLNSNSVVGEHLADQLLLPMALNAGGSFVTYSLSNHVLTNINVINQFLENAISTTQQDKDTVRINVTGLKKSESTDRKLQ